MRALAILNQKGGVGKTTTAVNVSAALARLGKRVMLIDLDPQAHATLNLGIELGDGEASVYDVLGNRRSVMEALRYVTDNYMILPSHVDLVAADLELAEQNERETVLKRAVAPLIGDVDFCVIDCAPSLGLLSVNALTTANEVIIPLQPHFLALQGLGKLLETVMLIAQDLNPTLRVSGILFSMFETGTRLAQEVTGDVEQFIAEAEADAPWRGATVFKTRIRRNIKLAEAPSFGQTIFDYAPSSNGAEDYTQLVEEILAMPSVEELATRELSADELGLAEPPQPEATEPAVSDSESPDQVAEPIEAPVDASQPAP
jgi:chromosome partitioning protein